MAGEPLRGQGNRNFPGRYSRTGAFNVGATWPPRCRIRLAVWQGGDTTGGPRGWPCHIGRGKGGPKGAAVSKAKRTHVIGGGRLGRPLAHRGGVRWSRPGKTPITSKRRGWGLFLRPVRGLYRERTMEEKTGIPGRADSCSSGGGTPHRANPAMAISGGGNDLRSREHFSQAEAILGFRGQGRG